MKGYGGLLQILHKPVDQSLDSRHAAVGNTSFAPWLFAWKVVISGYPARWAELPLIGDWWATVSTRILMFRLLGIDWLGDRKRLRRDVLLKYIVNADGTGKVVAPSTDQGGFLVEIPNWDKEHAQCLGHFDEVHGSSPASHTGSISLLNHFLNLLVDAAYKEEEEHGDDGGDGGVVDCFASAGWWFVLTPSLVFVLSWKSETRMRTPKRKWEWNGTENGGNEKMRANCLRIAL